MTQAGLAEKLGFADRQILSNLEKGLRQATPDELLIITRILGKSLEYFTDPYLLTNESVCFSWRVKKEKIGGEVPYQEAGKKLIAAYMHFSDILGKSPNLILPQLVVKKDATYDMVMELAEQLSKLWEMGDKPTERLEKVVWEKLGIELLYVNAPDEVSGASFRNERFCAMLINKNQSEGRRNFSIAHELFHILTWTTLHPDYVSPEEQEDVTAKSEKMANVFASSLLMPTETVVALWKERPKSVDLGNWLEEQAKGMHVSPDALFWRLVSLRRLKRDDFPEGLNLPYSGSVQPFSQKFIEMTSQVLDQGVVSVRKVLKLLDLNVEELNQLLEANGLPSPYAI
jgi:Zn-dependent peptidase ImmA (M78 family)